MIRRSPFLPFLAGLGVSLAMLLALAASDITQPDGSGRLVQAAILGSTSLLLGVLIGVLLSRTRRPQQVPQEASGSLRQILDALPDGILHCSREGEILMANRTAAQLLGQQEVLDEKLASRFVLVDRLSRAPFTPALWAELQRGNPVSLPGEACLVSSEGMEFELEGHGIPLTDADGAPAGAVLTFRDVTEAHERQRRLPDHLESEAVTGLPLARVLIERLERNLLSKRAVDQELSYLHIELDGFSSLVRDAGQTVADQLLRQAAQIMLSRLRDTDTLARVGEQAFGLLLPACPREVSERILGTLEESVQSMTFAWQGRPYPLSARIGIVHVPPFAGAYDECQALASKAAASKA